jgi:hypothetical protein
MGLAGVVVGYLFGALAGYYFFSGDRGGLMAALIALLVGGPTGAVILGVIGFAYKWPNNPPPDSR